MRHSQFRCCISKKVLKEVEIHKQSKRFRVLSYSDKDRDLRCLARNRGLCRLAVSRLHHPSVGMAAKNDVRSSNARPLPRALCSAL